MPFLVEALKKNDRVFIVQKIPIPRPNNRRGYRDYSVFPDKSAIVDTKGSIVILSVSTLAKAATRHKDEIGLCALLTNSTGNYLGGFERLDHSQERVIMHEGVPVLRITSLG